MTDDTELHRSTHPPRTGTVPLPHLVPEVSDRGLRYLPRIELPDGQVWRTYTSSDALHASTWVSIGRPGETSSTRLAAGTGHLTVQQAWEYARTLEAAANVGESVALVAGDASSTVPAPLVRLVVDQLHWVVRNHHWGDMRPKALTQHELRVLLDRVRDLGDAELLTDARRDVLMHDAADLLDCVSELEALLRG